MNRAHISSLTFDVDGVITIENLEPDSGMGEVTRRTNRVATLDGGYAKNDFGHSYADATIRLRWRPKSEAHFAAAQRLVKLYPEVRVFIAEGVYLAIPERIVRSGAVAEITLLALERLDQ